MMCEMLETRNGDILYARYNNISRLSRDGINSFCVNTVISSKDSYHDCYIACFIELCDGRVLLHHRDHSVSIASSDLKTINTLSHTEPLITTLLKNGNIMLSIDLQHEILDSLSTRWFGACRKVIQLYDNTLVIMHNDKEVSVYDIHNIEIVCINNIGRIIDIIRLFDGRIALMSLHQDSYWLHIDKQRHLIHNVHVYYHRCGNNDMNMFQLCNGSICTVTQWMTIMSLSGKIEFKMPCHAVIQLRDSNLCVSDGSVFIIPIPHLPYIYKSRIDGLSDVRVALYNGHTVIYILYSCT